jgi:hypothetical protein
MTLKPALKRAGSLTALARVLQVTRQAAQQYQKNGLPKKRALQLSQATAEDWHRARVEGLMWWAGKWRPRSEVPVDVVMKTRR